MGDKSPKSKNKDKKQKAGKTAASEQAKRSAIAAKQGNRSAAPPKGRK
jgi:hypothetical protein